MSQQGFLSLPDGHPAIMSALEQGGGKNVVTSLFFGHDLLALPHVTTSSDIQVDPLVSQQPKVDPEEEKKKKSSYAVGSLPYHAT